MDVSSTGVRERLGVREAIREPPRTLDDGAGAGK
jgi:hypothetical protein